MADQNFELALAAFQAQHGGAWSLFLGSPLWRAARAFLIENGPQRRFAALPADDILRHGIVYSGNMQGFHEALSLLEALGNVIRDNGDPADFATYLDSSLTGRTAADPAPQAPPPPSIDPKPKPTHRKKRT